MNINDKLSNGATVIAFAQVQYNGIVLANCGTETHPKYVTWAFDPTNHDCTVLGHYFDDDYYKAVEDYISRVTQNVRYRP